MLTVTCQITSRMHNICFIFIKTIIIIVSCNITSRFCYLLLLNNGIKLLSPTKTYIWNLHLCIYLYKVSFAIGTQKSSAWFTWRHYYYLNIITYWMFKTNNLVRQNQQAIAITVAYWRQQPTALETHYYAIVRRKLHKFQIKPKPHL